VGVKGTPNTPARLLGEEQLKKREGGYKCRKEYGRKKKGESEEEKTITKRNDARTWEGLIQSKEKSTKVR